MKKQIFMLSLIVLSMLFIGYSSDAQHFKNGDLEGDRSRISRVPDFWHRVPFTDINCNATEAGADSPDLTSPTGPAIEYGLAGMPYSGETFVSGTYSSASEDLVFQEGIMQSVSGFEHGDTYQINFFQAVSRGFMCRDTTGSWAVYLNDSLLGITTPSKSLIAFDDIALEWEERTLSFTAEKETYLIKFLPWDDDTSRECDSTKVDGGLGMAIDCIRLTNTNVEPNESNKLILYPNPTNSSIKIEIESHDHFKELEIINAEGRLMTRYLLPKINQVFIDLPEGAGVYFIKIKTRKDSYIRKVVKM